MSKPAAVYRLLGAGSELLYIGSAEDLERRWKHHSYMQPWWPEVQQKTVEWYPDRDTALAVEEAAIKAERPRYNVIHALVRPSQPERIPSEPSRYLSAAEVAAKAGVSRHTVEREIHRDNLTAEKKAGRWIIQDDEAERWLAQFRLYAEQRGRLRQPPAG